MKKKRKKKKGEKKCGERDIHQGEYLRDVDYFITYLKKGPLNLLQVKNHKEFGVRHA